MKRHERGRDPGLVWSGHMVDLSYHAPKMLSQGGHLREVRPQGVLTLDRTTPVVIPMYKTPISAKYCIMLNFLPRDKILSNRLYLASRVTDKPVALEFQVELEFRNVSF